MKILVVMLSLVAFSAFAQNVDVKGVEGDGDTTIQIKKGKQPIDKQYEIVSGQDDVEGDAAPLLKDARDNWKKACSDWKKEIKDMNKENQVISISCGKMSCSTQAMESTCTSTGTHKIRVKVN